MDGIIEPPIAIVETKYLVTYKYHLSNIILNQEVTIYIEYFNSEPRIVYQSVIKLTGEEYTAWGQDDSYINNIVLADVEKMRNMNALAVITSSN